MNGKAKWVYSTIGAAAVIVAALFWLSDRVGRSDLGDHVSIDGHPVMAERVGHVEKDIQNIQRDVSEIKRLQIEILTRLPRKE